MMTVLAAFVGVALAVISPTKDPNMNGEVIHITTWRIYKLCLLV
jgi:hypothetical protein